MTRGRLKRWDCYVRVGIGVRTNATTPNNVKTCSASWEGYNPLKTMCNARALWKNCANESSMIALRFSDHGTKEMFGIVGSKVWPISILRINSQYATTCNMVWKRIQHVTSNNVGSCWPTHILRPFARKLESIYLGREFLNSNVKRIHHLPGQKKADIDCHKNQNNDNQLVISNNLWTHKQRGKKS